MAVDLQITKTVTAIYHRDSVTYENDATNHSEQSLLCILLSHAI